MSNVVKAAVVAAMVVSGLSAPRRAAAYSALAHEANIDAPWDSTKLRSNLVAYYGDVDSLPAGTCDQRQRSAKVRRQLALLDAVKTP